MSIVNIEAANPDVAAPACLGKRRFETEEEARESSPHRPYFCGWCGGWHVASAGWKGRGKKKGQGSIRRSRA